MSQNIFQSQFPIQREKIPHPSPNPQSSGFLLKDNGTTERQQNRKWQIVPPMVTEGHTAMSGDDHDASTASVPPYPAQPGRMQQILESPSPRNPDREAFYKISFLDQDQQWYSIDIPKNMLAQAQPAQAPTHKQSQSFFTQASPTTQMVPEPTTPTWHDQSPDEMWGRPYSEMSERLKAVRLYQKETTVQDLLLHIAQPGLAGLMNCSLSTLAPLLTVAFATHQPFITFLVGIGSALGVSIGVTISEAFSGNGDTTGRGKPSTHDDVTERGKSLVRGGVAGLITFVIGASHALPFLMPNIRLALLIGSLVVAIELLVVAAIRHKFFGIGWWFSVVQVVGGGALVFLAALWLGNA